ncbi:uncharacterized protein A1O9_00364 [Exophiala aquamarina CBS 119918]|uniref:Uncharacterized protein n=1 Tax=Exophiala aquamarina CBS 119918 TaxID=1182545 RepID=A0A072PRM3_9EURO|nr:uncharacterized protein A1O9_00364 [Exophiala aquamarina CBS 119918]KEF62392.1 hypothetical protein A1O9_00364 [Exophiala aquamarina CBS 119918]
MATKDEVCPIVGTTNTFLPPKHPDFDMNQPGLVCPVTKASTDHHHNLHKHPGVFDNASDLSNAEQCPALTKIVSRPEQQAMDEAICPVVGTVSSVLPPNHPPTENAKEGDVCPVTNAQLGHHKGKVHAHPSVANAAQGARCPVVGATA